MSPKLYSLLAAVIFAAIAVLQLARAIVGMSITIGDVSIPLAASWGACAVAILLAWLGYRASQK